jgi:hypothetical protein
MGHLVIARGGPNDGEVVNATEAPDPTTSWWYQGSPYSKEHPHGPYRVTDQFEDLPDGRRAQVVNFDG